MTVAPAVQRRFIGDCLSNDGNRAILDRLPALGVAQPWLVAGCLFQTVWNLRGGRPPGEQIADYDVFYFDASDRSAAAETAVRARAERLFAELDVKVEVCNQARVHLWFESYFGHRYTPLASATEGIDRFLVLCTCVGLQPGEDGAPRLYAPHGLDDLYAGLLRRNPRAGPVELFRRKAASYAARWPWLTIEDETAGARTQAG